MASDKFTSLLAQYHQQTTSGTFFSIIIKKHIHSFSIFISCVLVQTLNKRNVDENRKLCSTLFKTTPLCIHFGTAQNPSPINSISYSLQNYSSMHFGTAQHSSPHISIVLLSSNRILYALWKNKTLAPSTVLSYSHQKDSSVYVCILAQPKTPVPQQYRHTPIKTTPLCILAQPKKQPPTPSTVLSCSHQTHSSVCDCMHFGTVQNSSPLQQYCSTLTKTTPLCILAQPKPKTTTSNPLNSSFVLPHQNDSSVQFWQ